VAATIDANPNRYTWNGEPRYYKAQRGGRGPTRWFCVSEVATALGVHVETVRRWIHRGWLKATAIHAKPDGGKGHPHWRIQQRDLTAFLRSENATAAAVTNFAEAIGRDGGEERR